MSKFLFIIILALAAAFLGLFYLGPQWQKFIALKQKTEELGEISAEFDELIKKTQILSEEISSVSRDDMARLDQAVPRGAKVPEYMAAMEIIAARNGVILKNVDITPPASKEAQKQAGATAKQPKPVGEETGAPQNEDIKKLPININVSANYESFKKFIAELEKFARLTNITSISFASALKPEDIINFNIRGEINYQ